MKSPADFVRDCRYGHGPLVREKHAYTLDQIEPNDGSHPVEFPWWPTGSVYAVVLWQCNTCGYIELFDEEK